ncbi:MAG TPA: glycoside hydrolase family protein [Cyclobacteriaceae bacterium]|nr:glycoside hydrolase family protein [Cyclobacteriaceae bacterium]
MITGRRKFLKAAAASPFLLSAFLDDSTDEPISDFCKRLKPIGRILERESEYVWCNAPIEGPDGKIHVFFSKWHAAKNMSGWLNGSEIAHAVAATPEGPYEFVETVIAPRAGYFDATTCHNPHIKKVGDTYYLFYMGNSNGKTSTKRIGLATAPSLNGPWTRRDTPLLEPGPAGAWDDHCTTNPSYVTHPNGSNWLYYKSWNTLEYKTATGPVRGNRKYGLAIADMIEGPYTKYERNPVLDFSSRSGNAQLEDAFVWFENGLFKMIARDMGFFNHEYGLYLESKDGLQWSEPKIAYKELKAYVTEPTPPSYLKKYGRFERPQILFRDGKPAYLFTAAQGGKYETSTGFVFRIES